jgi:hypothetical protein
MGDKFEIANYSKLVYEKSLGTYEVNIVRLGIPWILLEFLTVSDYIKLKMLNHRSYHQEDQKDTFLGGTISSSKIIPFLIKIGSLNQV